MTRHRAHAVVVLAAGRSTRLGQPKQLLRRDGETLLHRAVRLGTDTAPDALVVVLAAAEGPIVAALANIAYQRVINSRPTGGGLGDSLRAAAPHVQCFDQVLVLTCDQPALSAIHLDALLAGAAHAISGCAASRLEGRPGVPAVVPGHWFSQLAVQQPADALDTGFRTRLRQLDPATLFLLHDPLLEQDIDTPADLASARATGLLDPG